MSKLSILSFALILIGSTLWFLSHGVEPEVATQVNLATVNGGAVENATNLTYRTTPGFKVSGILLLIAGCIWPVTYVGLRATGKYAVLVCALLLAGCGEKDPAPEYMLVQPNETAFVVPLEGDAGNQVKFDSEAAVAKFKVATRRILVTTRMEKTGNVKKWLPTISIIKVDRSPVTRQWESTDPKLNNGIWTESADSVGFGVGFSVTASITEEKTALFLYRYSGVPLAKVMDEEIRARIQSACTDFASKHPMDALRGLKGEMAAAIKADVVPFFEERGIHISTIGAFGGLTYENPKIQESIDLVFVAQQEKLVAAALLTAQKDKNERMRQEGEGEASKAQAIAKGKAEAERTEAAGRASGIELVAKAAREAGQDPLFLQLRTLETITEQIKKWDGKYPTFMMSGQSGSNPLLLIQLPTATTSTANAVESPSK